MIQSKGIRYVKRLSEGKIISRASEKLLITHDSTHVTRRIYVGILPVSSHAPMPANRTINSKTNKPSTNIPYRTRTIPLTINIGG